MPRIAFLTGLLVVVADTLVAQQGASLDKASAPVGFYYTECWGDIMKWEKDKARLKRLPGNMPTGSAEAVALIRSESRWNLVPGDSFTFVDATDNDAIVTLGGDGNEVASQYSDFVGEGVLAVTYMRVDWCGPLDELWPGHNMLIKEADILFNEYDYTFNTGVPDPRRYEPAYGIPYLRPAALHELGHVLGLEHEDRSIATMNSGYPAGGWYPGLESPADLHPEPALLNRAIPHGDDRAGIRFIYPGSGAPQIDIGVLNFAKRHATGGVSLVAPPTPDVVCPGDVITIEYNFGNVGTEPVDFNLAFYLSRDETIAVNDIFVASESWSSGVGLYSYGPGVLSRSLTIPASVGFSTPYYVGVYADFDQRVREVREANNAVALPGKITIRPKTACSP